MVWPKGLKLAAAVLAALGGSFYLTLTYLQTMSVSIIGVADNSAIVSVNGRLIGTIAGEEPVTLVAGISSGDTLRLRGHDDGGLRGVCVVVLDDRRRLITGTLANNLSAWSEIDAKTGQRKGPAQWGSNQIWPPAVSALTGFECRSMWGDKDASDVVLEVRVP